MSEAQFTKAGVVVTDTSGAVRTVSVQYLRDQLLLAQKSVDLLTEQIAACEDAPG